LPAISIAFCELRLSHGTKQRINMYSEQAASWLVDRLTRSAPAGPQQVAGAAPPPSQIRIADACPPRAT